MTSLRCANALCTDWFWHWWEVQNLELNSVSIFNFPAFLESKHKADFHRRYKSIKTVCVNLLQHILNTLLYSLCNAEHPMYSLIWDSWFQILNVIPHPVVHAEISKVKVYSGPSRMGKQHNEGNSKVLGILWEKRERVLIRGRKGDKYRRSRQKGKNNSKEVWKVRRNRTINNWKFLSETLIIV